MVWVFLHPEAQLRHTSIFYVLKINTTLFKCPEKVFQDWSSRLLNHLGSCALPFGRFKPTHNIIFTGFHFVILPIFNWFYIFILSCKRRTIEHLGWFKDRSNIEIFPEKGKSQDRTIYSKNLFSVEHKRNILRGADQRLLQFYSVLLFPYTIPLIRSLLSEYTVIIVSI